jgi:hypothetical protein
MKIKLENYLINCPMTVNSALFHTMDYLVASKELLYFIPLALDALIGSFTIYFAIGSPTMLLEGLKIDKKLGDDTDFLKFYDLFKLCYSGYILLLFGSLFVNKIDRVMFGWIWLTIMICKVILIVKSEKKFDIKNEKISSLLFFQIPCYSLYCLLSIWF